VYNENNVRFVGDNMNNKTIAIKMVDYASTLLGLSDIEVFFKSRDFFPHKDVNSMSLCLRKVLML